MSDTTSQTEWERIGRTAAQAFEAVIDIYDQTHRLIDDLARESKMGLELHDNNFSKTSYSYSWQGDEYFHLQCFSVSWNTDQNRHAKLISRCALITFTVFFHDFDENTPMDYPILLVSAAQADKIEVFGRKFKEAWWEIVAGTLHHGKRLADSADGNLLNTITLAATVESFAYPLTRIDSIQTAELLILRPLRCLCEGDRAGALALLDEAVIMDWMTQQAPGS